MKITTDYNSGTLTVNLCGELDHHAAKETMRAIEKQIDRNLPKRGVLNLSALTFMDSSGIAVILKTKKRMDEIGGTLVVENIAPQPEKVINAAGLGRIVKITALRG